MLCAQGVMEGKFLRNDDKSFSQLWKVAGSV